MKPEIPAGAILDATSQKLIEAALYMEKHGHCKEHETIGQSVCLVGALNAVNAAWGEHKRLAEYLGVRCSENDGHDIAIWNDRPETTAEDAIAALWGAALMERRG